MYKLTIYFPTFGKFNQRSEEHLIKNILRIEVNYFEGFLENGELLIWSGNYLLKKLPEIP